MHIVYMWSVWVDPVADPGVLRPGGLRGERVEGTCVLLRILGGREWEWEWKWKCKCEWMWMWGMCVAKMWMCCRCRLQ